MLIEHCLAEEGTWLKRPEACRSCEAHYAGHERSGRYRDRRRDADGPYVEYEAPAASEQADND